MTTAELDLLLAYMVDAINSIFSMFIDLLSVWVVLAALAFVAMGISVVFGIMYSAASSRLRRSI